MKTPRLGCSTFLGQLRVAWDRACVGRVGQRFFFFFTLSSNGGWWSQRSESSRRRGGGSRGCVWRTACGNCQDLFSVGMVLSGEKGTVSPMICSPLESPFLSPHSPTLSSLATWSDVFLPSHFSYVLLFPQPGLTFPVLFASPDPTHPARSS